MFLSRTASRRLHGGASGGHGGSGASGGHGESGDLDGHGGSGICPPPQIFLGGSPAGEYPVRASGDEGELDGTSGDDGEVVKVGQFTSNSFTLNVGAPQGLCPESPALLSLHTRLCVLSQLHFYCQIC